MKNQCLLIATFAIAVAAAGCNKSDSSADNSSGTNTPSSMSVQDVKDGASNALENTRDMTTNAWQNVKEGSSNAWEKTKEVTTNALDKN
jgi:hypothetical protein